MKRPISKTKLYSAIAISAIIIISACAIYPTPTKNDGHKPITQELINLLKENPEIRDMLEKSIAEAKRVNPDPKTNPVQRLEDYYDFIDWSSEALPWDILKNQSFTLVYDQVDQSLDYFYFLIDQPLPELEGKGLYRNCIQYYEPFRSWLINFIRTWEAFLDTENSWSEAYYQKFYNDPRFGLQKEWYEGPSNWKTFNQFFSRKLESPDMRPIASPDDQAVVVSPADAVPQGVWAIDENSNIQAVSGSELRIKSATYYGIKDLLGNDSQYKDAFANGVLTHTFLDVYDYHCYHFAVGGTVKEVKIIYWDDAVGGETAWSPEKGRYVLYSSMVGWQFIQTRGYVIMDTGKYGLVAIVPVGMSQISSVNFEDIVQVGTTHKKGDMLGCFLCGGSDVVMLFQEKAGFEITAPMDNETAYKHVLMGEEYGLMKGSE